MQNHSYSNKRKTYFIEKDFQARFILKFFGLVVLGGLLTIGVLYLLSMKSTTVSIVNSRVMVRSTADFILPVLIQTVVVVMILVSIATVIVTLFISHKIAGPLYRFKRVLQALSEGDFSAGFNIRHRDQLQELAKLFNEMIQKTRQQLNLMKASYSSLKEKLDDLSENEVSESKKGSLANLKRISEDLNHILRYFKS